MCLLVVRLRLVPFSAHGSAQRSGRLPLQGVNESLVGSESWEVFGNQQERQENGLSSRAHGKTQNGSRTLIRGHTRALPTSAYGWHTHAMLKRADFNFILQWGSQTQIRLCAGRPLLTGARVDCLLRGQPHAYMQMANVFV